MSAKPKTLRLLKGRWVLPVDREPITNGAVLIKGERVKSVLTREEFEEAVSRPELTVEDFGEAIILPGLINLHTHLEYSALKGLAPDLNFFSWVRALIAASSAWAPDDWAASALTGVRAALLSGTTCLVENSYTGLSARFLAHAGLRAVVGLELFGVNQETAPEQFANWLKKLDSVKEGADQSLKEALAEKRIKLAVAPHAPYTVCPALWRLADQWALEEKSMVLAHVAESPEECQWFGHGNQVVDGHLSFAFGRIPSYKGDPVALAAQWRGQNHSPVAHLNEARLLNERLLATHCVEIDDDDARLLSAHRTGLAHCPRSNARLRNGHAPINTYQENRLAFGFGTDSLASSDDLSLLAEARFAIALHRAINPELNFGARQAIEHLTLKAAQCLHMEGEIGSLTANKKADIVVFEVAHALSAREIAPQHDPFDLLIYGDGQLIASFVDGKEIFNRAQSASESTLVSGR